MPHQLLWAVHSACFLIVLALGYAISVPRVVHAADDLSVGNEQLAFSFDSASGALTRIDNKAANQAYLQAAGNGQGNPFRLFLCPEKYGEIVEDRYPYQPHPQQGAEFTSLQSVEPGEFALTRQEHQSNDVGDTLVLELEHAATGLAVRIQIAVPKDAVSSTWTMRLTNKSDQEQIIATWFPCFADLSLGEPEDVAVAVPNGVGYVRKLSESQAGVDIDYGGGWSMQWFSQFNRKQKLGFGIIVQDPQATGKVFEYSIQPFIYVGYFPKRISPGQSIELPPTVVRVHRQDWKADARAYRAWFDSAFKIASTPRWFREINYADGGGVAEEKRIGPPFISFSSLRDIYKFADEFRQGAYSCFEVIGYQDAHRRGHVLNDGDYMPRPDMGGKDAFSQGLQRLHERGGHAVSYVEGLLTWVDSDVAQTDAHRQWSLMDLDGTLSAWYPQRYHQCSSSIGWQDYLAAKCKELASFGLDGIRLDSLGCTDVHPCYNPEHSHMPNPYRWNEGVRELLAKIRAAMTEVNPEPVLLTEGFQDFFLESCAGALHYGADRYQETLLRYTFPEAVIVPWYGEPENLNLLGVNGYSVARTGFPQSDQEKQLLRNWHRARLLFKDALIYGPILDQYPQSDAPDVVARCFQGKGYFLVTGLNPGSGPVRLTISDLGDIEPSALLLDVERFEFQKLPVTKVGDAHVISASGRAFLAFLPVDANCPKLLEISEVPAVMPGESVEIDLRLFGDWSDVSSATARVTCPGLIVDGQEGSATCTVPGKIMVSAPLKSDAPGRYALTVDALDNAFFGYQTFLEVRAPLQAAVDLETADTVSVAVVLKNNEQRAKKVSWSLVAPSTWSLPAGTIELGADEQKTIPLRPVLGRIPDQCPGLQIAVEHDYQGQQWEERAAYNFTNRKTPFLDLVGKEESCIREWLVYGPFPNSSEPDGPRSKRVWGNGRAFDTDFLQDQGGEAAAMPDEARGWRACPLKEYTLADLNRGEVSWNEYLASLQLDLAGAFDAPENVVGYVAAFIDRNQAGQATLWIRTGAGVKLWLNHEPIYQQTIRWDDVEVDTNFIKVQLRQGRNLFLAKVAHKTARGPTSFLFAAGIQP